MKLAGPQALAFCGKPIGKVRIALIFGADPGLVSAAADTLAGVWLPAGSDPLNLVKLTDEDLKRDAMRLGDELAARSLLGGDRLVRVRIDRETGAKPVLDLLADVESGQFTPEAAWIVEAGDLGRTSKLRSAFESSKGYALHLYADDEASIGDYVAGRLAKASIVIEPEALAAFVGELPGDRRLAMSETEKLELYADGLGRAVSLSDIALVAAAEQPKGADDAADAAILGDAMAASRSLDRFLDAGGSAISALRTLHFRLLRVIDALAGDGGGMRLRPPVFERDWPVYSRALKDWRQGRADRAVAELYSAERACKRAGAPAEAIVRTLMDRIARRTL